MRKTQEELYIRRSTSDLPNIKFTQDRYDEKDIDEALKRATVYARRMLRKWPRITLETDEDFVNKAVMKALSGERTLIEYSADDPSMTPAIELSKNLINFIYSEVNNFARDRKNHKEKQRLIYFDKQHSACNDDRTYQLAETFEKYTLFRRHLKKFLNSKIMIKIFDAVTKDGIPIEKTNELASSLNLDSNVVKREKRKLLSKAKEFETNV